MNSGTETPNKNQNRQETNGSVPEDAIAIIFIRWNVWIITDNLNLELLQIKLSDLLNMEPLMLRKLALLHFENLQIKACRKEENIEKMEN